MLVTDQKSWPALKPQLRAPVWFDGMWWTQCRSIPVMSTSTSLLQLCSYLIEGWL